MASTYPIDNNTNTNIGAAQCTNIQNNTGANGTSTNCANLPLEITAGIGADLLLVDNDNNFGEALPLNGASKCGASPLTLARILKNIKNSLDYVRCWLCRLEANIFTIANWDSTSMPNNYYGETCAGARMKFPPTNTKIIAIGAGNLNVDLNAGFVLVGGGHSRQWNFNIPLVGNITLPTNCAGTAWLTQATMNAIFNPTNVIAQSGLNTNFTINLTARLLVNGLPGASFHGASGQAEIQYISRVVGATTNSTIDFARLGISGDYDGLPPISTAALQVTITVPHTTTTGLNAPNYPSVSLQGIAVSFLSQLRR